MTEYDSPWKDILDEYFPSFMEFFFPALHGEIDWTRRFESLDTELQQIVREAELGARRVDRLFKVWRTTGEEEWILIHVEVQSQEDPGFPQRMFVYHYRILDRYDRVVVSLAILGDDRPSWRPNKFEYNNWGCKVEFEFPTVKLLDYAGREEELVASSNVFATVVLAHLKALETRGDVSSRRLWKLRIVRALYERGWSSDDVRKLFAFIDWLIDLPREIEQGFLTDVFAIEKEKHMPFVTNAERFGIEKGMEIGLERGRRTGLLEGIELALELKFGSDGLTLLPEIRSIQDVDRLSAIHRAIKTIASVEGLRALIAAE